MNAKVVCELPWSSKFSPEVHVHCIRNIFILLLYACTADGQISALPLQGHKYHVHTNTRIHLGET